MHNGDSKENIKKCLSCVRPSCSNCLGNGSGNGPRKVAVAQINAKTGRVAAIYESIAEAEKKTGIPRAHITRCIKGEWTSAGGYIWEVNSMYV